MVEHESRKIEIACPKAPKTIGPYSQAVVMGNLPNPRAKYPERKGGDEGGADKKADAVYDADQEHAPKRVLPRHLFVEQLQMPDYFVALVRKLHTTKV